MFYPGASETCTTPPCLQTDDASEPYTAPATAPAPEPTEDDAGDADESLPVCSASVQ